MAVCYEADPDLSRLEQAATLCNGARASTSATVAQVANANRNLGRAYLLAGTPLLSLEPLRRAAMLDPGREDVRLDLARALVATRQYDEAIDQVGAIPQQSELHTLGLLERAQAYDGRSAEGDLWLALHDLETARERASTDPNLAELGKLARAEMIRLAMKIAALERATGGMQALVRANDAYAKVAQIDPRNAGAHLGLAETCLDLSRRSEKPAQAKSYLLVAEQAFDDALRLGEDNADAHEGAALTLQALGRGADAIVHLQAAVRLDDTPQRYTALARALTQIGHDQIANGEATDGQQSLRSAAAHFEAALAREPANAQTLVSLAALQWNGDMPGHDLGLREAARATLTKATQMQPPDARALIELGRLTLDDTPTDPARARGLFAQALGVSRGSPDPSLRAQASYYLSRIGVESGQGTASEAIAGADFALSLEPENVLYRQQACLARIRFGEVRNEAAKQVCLTAGRGVSTGSLTTEGMYFLRRAQFASGGDRQRDLEDAYRSFSTAAARTTDTSLSSDLKTRLEVGKGIAHYCVGFATIGQQTINSAGPMRDQARAYFDTYKVARCEPY